MNREMSQLSLFRAIIKSIIIQATSNLRKKNDKIISILLTKIKITLRSLLIYLSLRRSLFLIIRNNLLILSHACPPHLLCKDELLRCNKTYLIFLQFQKIRLNLRGIRPRLISARILYFKLSR